jgi:hypothetical protein
MATPAGLDLSKAGLAAGPKAGSGQSSDRAGVWDLLKDSKPAIKLLQMVKASPRLPKREFPRLKPPKHATHELQLLFLLLVVSSSSASSLVSWSSSLLSSSRESGRDSRHRD